MMMYFVSKTEEYSTAVSTKVCLMKGCNSCPHLKL